MAVSVVAFLLLAAALPARDKVAVPPPRAGTQPASAAPAEPLTRPVTRPSWPAIPQATLQEMYGRELGQKYDPADAPRLYAAHQLIEQYFESARLAERKQIAGRIEAIGLDVNVIGRLTRLRMYWPDLEGGAVYYINEPFGAFTVRYFFGVPRGYDRTRPWPLVIKLPTTSPFLTDPPPDADDVVKIYTSWINQELAHHPDAIVLMPLLNLDELYGPSYAGMNSVIQSMYHAAERVNIDPARVYMVGHSEAAHGVWNLALHYGTYFAAVNPLAGAASQDWQRVRLVNLRNTLPVVWHDALDPAINVNFARSIVKAMRDLKLDVEYDETKGLGHAPTPEIVDRAYDKMRGRNRELYPQQIMMSSNRPDPIFNRLDWLQVWQAIDPGPDQRLLFRHGSGHMTIFQNEFKIEADRRRNRFDITTSNVESFRVLLNDQMVDFSAVVTVVVNKKSAFEALVKPSVESMLKDQVFLGRGWRYFSGEVDIDVVPPPKAATQPYTKPTITPNGHRGTITVGPGAAE